MSGEQKKFDTLMQRVIKVKPEELKRRLTAEKTAKKTPTKPAAKQKA